MVRNEDKYGKINATHILFRRHLTVLGKWVCCSSVMEIDSRGSLSCLTLEEATGSKSIQWHQGPRKAVRNTVYIIKVFFLLLVENDCMPLSCVGLLWWAALRSYHVDRVGDRLHKNEIEVFEMGRITTCRRHRERRERDLRKKDLSL